MDKLYFDYNATTPVAPRVFEAIKPYLTDQWGNPGSAHDWGLSAKSAVSKGRAQVAALINAEPENIIFTSCATESNNLALTSPFAQGGKGRIITQPTEHPAVLEPCVRLQEQGVEVTYLPVDGNGVADLSTLSELLGALLPGNSDAPGEAGLLSLMRANNETGVLQPVRAAAAQARDAGWLVHTDAAQAVAKIPIDVQELGVDYLTIAGHKLYAPKGIGALYVRPGAPLYPLFLGGGQERGLQPGTENVAYIAGLGEACAMAAEDLAMEVARITDLREYFIRGLHNMGGGFCRSRRGCGTLAGYLQRGLQGRDSRGYSFRSGGLRCGCLGRRGLPRGPDPSFARAGIHGCAAGLCGRDHPVFFRPPHGHGRGGCAAAAFASGAGTVLRVASVSSRADR